MNAPSRSTAKAEKPLLEFAGKDEWAAWLDENHASSDGVVLRLAKKNSGIPSLTYDEGVEVALCYGWIDGQGKREDDAFWRQSFSPRRARSIWSKRNREKALALIESGAMKPAGLAEVERAQGDGRWDAAYDSPNGMMTPEDFTMALHDNPAAEAFWQALDSRNRYAILFKLQTTKRPETRQKWIRQFVEMLARNEKLYP